MFNSTSHDKWGHNPVQKPSEGRVIAVLVYLGNWEKLGGGGGGGGQAQIDQIMGTDTQTMTESVELHISHKMRPYPSVKAIQRSSYTCFRVFGALGQFRGIWPKYSKS